MSSYDALAASYDALTVDVGYRRRADYLARQGSDYRAILEHYYTGASVVEREE